MFSIEREKVKELEQHVGSALEIVHHLARTTAHDFVRRYGPLRPHVEALLSYLEQEVSGARPDDPLP